MYRSKRTRKIKSQQSRKTDKSKRIKITSKRPVINFQREHLHKKETGSNGKGTIRNEGREFGS